MSMILIVGKISGCNIDPFHEDRRTKANTKDDQDLIESANAMFATIPNKLLPNKPSIDRDIEGTRNQTFTRPHIPPFRSTQDGRFAMQTRTKNRFDFYLFSPEKIDGSFLSSSKGTSILANKEAYSFSVEDFMGAEFSNTTYHSGICEAQQNPSRCGSGGSNDCYNLTIITPSYDKEKDQIQLWGTPIRVVIENPKTKNARIKSISRGEPEAGAVWSGVDSLLETNITTDGHLIVGRVGFKTEITWRDSKGERRKAQSNLVYSAYDRKQKPCDVKKFGQLKPITHAFFDPIARDNWGFAKFQLRDSTGKLIGDSENLGGTYPWIDSKGDNIFFTSFNQKLITKRQGVLNSDFAIKCVSNTSCQRAIPDDPDSIQNTTDPTLGLTVAGSWTQGKTILIDNNLNNIDYGLGADDSEHRMVKIYREDDGWVRMGNGRDNSPDGQLRGQGAIPPGGVGNSAFIDSIQNKLNNLTQMKPNIPRDVAWYISNGKTTDIVSFDDFVNANVLISSHMTQALEGVDLTPSKNLIQNAAGGGLYEVPAAGRIIGPGRVEPAALGGVRGKGFFAFQDGGLRYDITKQKFDSRGWYLGVFIDPRFPNDNKRRRLFEFPNGAGIDLVGRKAISLLQANDKLTTKSIGFNLPRDQYSHVGFRIKPNNVVEFYVNGMFVWQINGIGNSYHMREGRLYLGLANDGVEGFKGWLDDFKVVGNAMDMPVEEICNQSLGTLIGLKRNADADLKNLASKYPDAQQQISSQLSSDLEFQSYLCYSGNRTKDGWVDLNLLPDNTTSLRDASLFPEGPFLSNQPRPDSSQNTFCSSCHPADGAVPDRISSLTDLALLPSDLLIEEDFRRLPSDPPAVISGNPSQ